MTWPEKGELEGGDYAVIALLLAVSAGIGIYYRFTGGKQSTMEVKIDVFYCAQVIIQKKTHFLLIAPNSL